MENGQVQKFATGSKGEAGANGRAAAGALLRRLRDQAGLSQGALAARVSEIHATFISQLETGRAVLPSAKIGAVAEALGVDASDLAVRLLSFQDPALFCVMFGIEPTEAYDPARELAPSTPRPVTLNALLQRELAMSRSRLKTDDLLSRARVTLGEQVKRPAVYLTLYRLWRQGRVEKIGDAWQMIETERGSADI